MEVELPPDLSDNVEEGLAGLKRRGLKIGIVSDAIVTPGVQLRVAARHAGVCSNDLTDEEEGSA